MIVVYFHVFFKMIFGDFVLVPDHVVFFKQYPTKKIRRSNKPKTKKEVVAVKLVKRIMQAEEADATAG